MPWQLGTTSDLFQTVRKHCGQGVNHLLFHPWNKCKNWGRTKASNRSRTFVYISPIVCSLAIGLYLCLPGSDHPGCAGDLVKNVKHCHPHHILDRRQREEKEKRRMGGGGNKVVKDYTKLLKNTIINKKKCTWKTLKGSTKKLKLIKRDKYADGCLIKLNIGTINNICVIYECLLLLLSLSACFCYY